MTTQQAKKRSEQVATVGQHSDEFVDTDRNNRSNNNNSSSNNNNDDDDNDGDNDGDASNIQLCDIIAQQREFQRRQDTRSLLQRNPTISSANNQTKSQQQAFEHKALEQFPSLAGSNQISNNSKSNSSKPRSRRKFSLSYAMSNLASLRAAGSSGNISTNPETPVKKPLQVPPVRPARSLHHRGSLIMPGAGSLLQQHHQRDLKPLEQEESFQVPQSEFKRTSDSMEKKKGFVHKAIRRGSKMFDAMLLSSSQQQATRSSSERNKSGDTFSNSGSNSVSPDRETGGSGQRVQFAGSIEDEKPDLDEKKRKPRLRLGSIPHDLRRALSLSNNSQKFAAGGHQADKQSVKQSSEPEAIKQEREQDRERERDREEISGSKPVGSILAATTITATATAATTTTTTTPSSQSKEEHLSSLPKSRLFQVAPDRNRLRRKNSLFSPLSHAVHHYGSHSSSGQQHQHQQQQQQQQQQPQQSSSQLKLVANAASTGQSASFTLCQDHSRTYKLIIFGSSAVGKTSLIQRFLYGQFPVAHKPTVEELHSNKYNIPELGEIYLEILDTSGTFEFPAMRRLSIEKGDAFILVFSVCDRQSWEEVKHLRQLILEEKGGQQDATCGNVSSENFDLVSANKGSTSDKSKNTSQLEGGDLDKQEAIKSVYAAATKLTSKRRYSCATQDTTIVPKPKDNSPPPPPPLQQTNNPTSGQDNSNSSRLFTHYNSQLSKVLQQRQQSGNRNKTSSRNKSSLIKQSISIDDRDLDSSSDSASVSTSTDGSPSKSQPFSAPNSSSTAQSNKNILKTTTSTSKQLSLLVSNKPNTSNSHLQTNKSLRCKTPIVVVANKCDLDNIQVDQEEAQKLVCDVWGNSFVRCSAKEALNIDRVFKELLRQAKAPEILSQFVIDDHQQRRQSLPVLKNHLSAHHVKGLRSLYNQQQANLTSSQQQPFDLAQTMSNSTSNPNSNSNSNSAEDSQCLII